jgi:hypothetical protein
MQREEEHADMKRFIFPSFPVRDNGEKDGAIYRERFATLCNLISEIVPTGTLFFNDISISNSELERMLKEKKKEREEWEEWDKSPVILSTILDEPFSALKSQIHLSFCDDPSLIPLWYNKNLATDLSPHVLPGFAVFDRKSLERCIKAMLLAHSPVRVKKGAGCAGEDQVVLWNITDVPHIPECIFLDMETGGVVVEKNLADKRTFSYTSFTLPTGNFNSVGIILSTETETEHGTRWSSLYSGTTCRIFPENHEPDVDLSFNDPVHGLLYMSKEEMRKVLSVGKKITAIYRKHLPFSILPRVNLDLMYDDEDDRYVLVDTSLRVGGNSWCELKGAHTLLANDDLASTQKSIRMFYSNGAEMVTLFPNSHMIAQVPPSCMFGFEHENS